MNDYKELVAKCEEWIAKADNFGADDLANHISRCADAIEQLVKERDAEPVRHGHWVAYEDETMICATEFVCSACRESFVSSELTDKEFYEMMKHCPNCGAKMDEVSE